MRAPKGPGILRASTHHRGLRGPNQAFVRRVRPLYTQLDG